MTKQKGAITWLQLKEFVNTLNDNQLNKEVIVSGEERGFRIQSAELLGEDMVSTQDGRYPFSMFKPEDEDDSLEKQDIVKADTPYLYTDLYESIKED